MFKHNCLLIVNWERRDTVMQTPKRYGRHIRTTFHCRPSLVAAITRYFLEGRGLSLTPETWKHIPPFFLCVCRDVNFTVTQKASVLQMESLLSSVHLDWLNQTLRYNKETREVMSWGNSALTLEREEGTAERKGASEASIITRFSWLFNQMLC